MVDKTLEILYEGYREWIYKVKGYHLCASYEDIKLWEEFRQTIYQRLEAHKQK